MKFSFSTRNVAADSFLELCDKTAEYGFSGFEIFDAVQEKQQHADSIFHSYITPGAKRKLVNRHISIAALTYPQQIDAATDPEALCGYVEQAALAGCPNVIVQIPSVPENVCQVLESAVRKAQSAGVMILLETLGELAHTQRALEVIGMFGSAALGVCWNIRQTCFVGHELADTTIQTLGAYINYVRLGDRKDGTDVLIGDGELPVRDFMNALRSLNYDGFVCVDWNEEITDPDIVLTHFVSYMTSVTPEDTKKKPVYYNRARTGTHPWKKFDVIDLTFSQVLDEMVERYPDQYAFKYTTLSTSSRNWE